MNQITIKHKEDIQQVLEIGKTFNNVLKEIYDTLVLTKDTNANDIFIEIKNQLKKAIPLYQFSTIEYPFKKIKNTYEEEFNNEFCISGDDIVAHGRNKFQKLDAYTLFTLDIGLSFRSRQYKDRFLHLDTAFTVCNSDNENIKSLQLAPLKAIKKIIKSNCKTTKEIACLIRETALEHNLDSIISVCGHGIGYQLHEFPYIANAPTASSIKLIDGMLFCPEPIYAERINKEESAKEFNIVQTYIDSDGWSIKTNNKAKTSHWETTIAVIDDTLVDVIGLSDWEI